MKKVLISVFFILLSTLIIAQSVRVVKTNKVEERNGKQYFIHIVEKGQTVYSIAKAYDVTNDEIYFENPGSKTAISVNQEILIPTINKETEIRQEIEETDFEFFYHVCSDNETFADVSGIYLQSEAKIRNANPMSRPPFREGEYLKIPVDIPESVIRAEFPPEAVNRPSRTVPTPTKKANTVSFDPNMAVITDYRHVVIDGESTASIADKYKVDIKDLKAVNPGLGDKVERGERLRVPATANFGNAKPNTTKINTDKPTKNSVDVAEIKTVEKTQAEKPKEEPFVIHKVRKKETIYRISRDYGVSIQELYDANPGLTDAIKVDQQIRVPKKKIINSYVLYDVNSRTKLKKVAKLYGLSEIALIKFNPGMSKTVYSGQRVKIPVGNKTGLTLIKESEVKEDELVDKDSDTDVITDDISCPKINYGYNNTIKVALMVPLFLEELRDEELIEELMRGNSSGFQPFSFINFVEGAMLAVDSLRSMGVQIELKVYDVDKTLTKTAKVLQDPELKYMDLIIGPFYSQSYHQVALYAGNFNIPIINPLSYREEILSEYKTSVKVKPSELSQLPLLIDIVEHHPHSKVFLITQNSYRDADKVQTMENALRQIVKVDSKLSNMDLYNYSQMVAMRDEEWVSGDQIPSFSIEGKMLDPYFLNDNIADSTLFDNSLVRINYMSDGFDSFMNKASALRENVVVLYGRDKSFVMDVVNKLNEFRDSLNISLIGVPLWERLDNIDITQLDNLKTISFESSYIDYESDEVQDFIYNFRQHYSTDPGKYGFAGYDITWYFINAINMFGAHFADCLINLETDNYSGDMWFRKSFIDNSSYENTHWNIIQYGNFSKRKIYLYPRDIE